MKKNRRLPMTPYRILSAISLIAMLTTGAVGASHKPQTGVYDLSIAGSRIGTDTFSQLPLGGSSATVKIKIAQTSITENIQVKQLQGKVTSIENVATPGGQIQIIFSKGLATFKLNGKTIKSFPVTTKVSLWGNYAPNLLETVIGEYDRKKGGSQKIPGISVESPVVLNLILKEEKSTSVKWNNHNFRIRHYSVSIPGPLGNIDITVDTSDSNEVLRWNVPSQQYVAVLRGYEALFNSEMSKIPGLSEPVYSVHTLPKILILMRDGVKLAATVYLPNSPGKFPVILERTPYGRKNILDGMFYAKRGYAVVLQDVRGRYGSGGKWEPFLNEANDGHDTVSWCASQPWSNGKVGMIGGSYLGYTQWAAAQEGVGALKCIVPIVSPPNPLDNVPYDHGDLLLLGDIWWAEIANGRTNGAIGNPNNINLRALFTLPLSKVDSKVEGHSIPAFQFWLNHPPDSKVWESADFNKAIPTLGHLPVLMVSGWFDGDGIGTKLNYAGMVNSGHTDQYLIYGPWTHDVDSTSRIGSHNFGSKSLIDLNTLYLEWFDHWLKGKQNPITTLKPVRVFLMGTNEWKEYSSWPPKRATMEKWYLNSGGHANANRSDGTLSTEMPLSTSPSDHYNYNPAHPFMMPSMADAMEHKGNIQSFETVETKDPQALLYTSPKLTQAIIVAGPVSLHLWATSSALNTDWMAWLEDIGPDGKPFLLCAGTINALYRHGFIHPEALTPGKPVEYTLDLWATGNVFLPGHRIRIVVTSSDFPGYARNLNTLEPIANSTAMVTAHQTVMHDLNHSSYVLLPVVK